jgi:hypothetical protein
MRREEVVRVLGPEHAELSGRGAFSGQKARWKGVFGNALQKRRPEGFGPAEMTELTALQFVRRVVVTENTLSASALSEIVIPLARPKGSNWKSRLQLAASPRSTAQQSQKSNRSLRQSTLQCFRGSPHKIPEYQRSALGFLRYEGGWLTAFLIRAFTSLTASAP